MHKNAIDVKPGGVVRLYFGFDTKSGPQCQLRACMHDTKWRPGEASNGRTGGGWGGGGGDGGDRPIPYGHGYADL